MEIIQLVLLQTQSALLSQMTAELAGLNSLQEELKESVSPADVKQNSQRAWLLAQRHADLAHKLALRWENNLQVSNVIFPKVIQLYFLFHLFTIHLSSFEHAASRVNFPISFEGCKAITVIYRCTKHRKQASITCWILSHY